MTTSHDPQPREPLSPRARAAWRRAADELLIDAIFGAGYEPMRVGEPSTAPTPAPAPHQPASPLG